MYKIKYIPTNHVFELPDITAEDLKERYPSDYKILEKNGKKYRDRMPKKEVSTNGSIRNKVVEV